MALQIRDALGNVVNAPLYDPAYRAARAACAYTTAKDVMQIAGAAGSIIRIKQVRATVVAAAAAGDLALTLVKRSTLTVTGTTLTAVPLDSASPTATAVLLYSLSGTVGTPVGVIAATSLSVNATATIPSTAVFTWDFTNKGDQPPLLRSATEALCLNVANGGTTPTSATISVEIQWEESTVS